MGRGRARVGWGGVPSITHTSTTTPTTPAPAPFLCYLYTGPALCWGIRRKDQASAFCPPALPTLAWRPPELGPRSPLEERKLPGLEAKGTLRA